MRKLISLLLSFGMATTLSLGMAQANDDWADDSYGMEEEQPKKEMKKEAPAKKKMAEKKRKRMRAKKQQHKKRG